MVPGQLLQAMFLQMEKIYKNKILSFDNSAHITCFSNDYGFDKWIVETIKNCADKNDLVILLSASGNSQNMINAAKFLNKKRLIIIL